MAREKLSSMEDLLKHELRDLYSAESQLVSALPEMSKAATNSELKDAFNTHLKETKEQKKRLEKVGKQLNFDMKGETCEAMQGLVQEGKEIIGMEGDNDVKDAALIAAAQRVEHYEIAGYGSAYHFAKLLGHQEVCDMLQETLEEEKKTDSLLNKLAMERINQEAKKS